MNKKINVHNNGPSDGTSATLNDNLSTALKAAKYCVDSGSACNPATGSAWTGTNAVFVFASGENTTYWRDSSSDVCSSELSISNTATVSAQSPTDANSANDSATASTTVTR